MKALTREKFYRYRTYLIVLFIPMVFTLLFGGLMKDVFVEEIPIAVYDMDNSPMSQTVIDSFYDCGVFTITEDVDSEAEIEEAMLRGELCGAVLLPAGFGAGIQEKSGTEALVLIDGSNLLIGNNITLYATTIFNMVNAGIQINLLEAGGMVPYAAEQSVYTLNLVDRVLYNPQLGYFYYLFAGLLGIFVQQTFLAVVPIVLIEEKRRLRQLPGCDVKADMRMRRGSVAARVGIYAILNAVSMLSCLVLAHLFFAYPINGKLSLLLLIHAVFIAGLFGVCLVLASLFEDSTHCAQFVMFLAVPSMLCCGYGWPEYMMAPGFAPVMKLVLPLYYFANPLKDLMLKGAGLEVIGRFVTGGLLFAALWLAMGTALYTRKIILIKKWAQG